MRYAIDALIVISIFFFSIAVTINHRIIIFFTGIVNMFGVPMKATWTAIFLMFGLSPVSTLTMTLVLGCLSPLTGGFSIIRSGNYHQKTAVSAATAGALGAFLGVMFALSLAPLALNIILIGAMIIAIMAVELKDRFTKEQQNKVFVQLLIIAAVNLLVLMICAFLFFDVIANIFCPM